MRDLSLELACTGRCDQEDGRPFCSMRRCVWDCFEWLMHLATVVPRGSQLVLFMDLNDEFWLTETAFVESIDWSAVMGKEERMQEHLAAALVLRWCTVTGHAVASTFFATGPTFAGCAFSPLLAFLACALLAGAARVAHATPAALNGAAACAA